MMSDHIYKMRFNYSNVHTRTTSPDLKKILSKTELCGFLQASNRK